jgi:hypothetical protein
MLWEMINTNFWRLIRINDLKYCSFIFLTARKGMGRRSLVQFDTIKSFSRASDQTLRFLSKRE